VTVVLTHPAFLLLETVANTVEHVAASPRNKSRNTLELTSSSFCICHSLGKVDRSAMGCCFSCLICRGPSVLDAIKSGDTRALQDCIAADPNCVNQTPSGCCCSGCCCWHHPARSCECWCYSNVFADTPLHVAIRYFLLRRSNRQPYRDVIQILLAAKADVNATTRCPRNNMYLVFGLCYCISAAFD
jgi:hypothetical protein